MASLPRNLVVLILLCLTLATSSNNHTDYHSLVALKNAILDPLEALHSWNDKTQFCSWKGIQCSRKHPGRVVIINLMSQGFAGSFSPSIGNLSFLRKINLQNNSFHGVIPNEIGRLRRLRFVDFSNNSFSGAIPKNLSECSNLVYLNLIDNLLSSTIPLEFSALYKIQKLGLGKNKLSGHLPHFIGNLTSLTLLSIRSSNLIGEIPKSLGQLRNMISLILSDNSFTGNIPSTLFNISTILLFDFSKNQLQGSIPSTIGVTLPNLIILSLAENQFSGVLPTSISNASSLEYFQLSNNYFRGPIPSLGRLSRLRAFLIAVNPIQDDIKFISPLANCTNLKIVLISGNLVSGTLPNSVGNLSSRLSMLFILESQVHGHIPSGIGNLVGLTTLSLFGNNLEGNIPSSMGQLSRLQRLHLGANRFTSELPFTFDNMTFLIDVSLEMNKLSGGIPKSLNHCKNLLTVDLSNNNFSGPIPLEIMNLSSISIKLDLSFNALTHALPPEIQSLTHLSTLNLSNNRLSGAIPKSLSHCTSLVRLDLEENLFEGEIPEGLVALKGLLYLDVSRNNFSGLIPRFLGELQLERLNLSFNSFEGEVPTIGVFANQTAVSVEGNKDLCGGILDLKLPTCPRPKSSKNKLPILLKTLIPVGLVLLLSLVIFFYKNRKPEKDFSSSSPLSSTQFLRLSYSDLLKATNEFSESNLLGAGRFGSVYQGILNDGQTLVAVKVLNLLVTGASKSFMKECNALRHTRHRNLLKILSVCESIDFKGNNFKSLVYEFKDNGSLEKWLHYNVELTEENGAKLNNADIIQRLNIAIDIAHALEYLHCGTGSIIVHGDLKPSNILLDHDLTAYVGDFGLAKVISSIIPTQESSTSTWIKGTIGYVPPEYCTSNRVSTQGDVYSYGILLLEMFTNRRPTDELFKDHWNLHSFVAVALPDCVEEIVDQLVRVRYDMNDVKVKDCLTSILRIGVIFSNEDSKDRMSMPQVVCELHKIKRYFFA